MGSFYWYFFVFMNLLLLIDNNLNIIKYVCYKLYWCWKNDKMLETLRIRFDFPWNYRLDLFVKSKPILKNWTFCIGGKKSVFDFHDDFLLNYLRKTTFNDSFGENHHGNLTFKDCFSYNHLWKCSLETFLIPFLH